MVVDVSEIKAFRHCRRQWQLSSRNQFHMTAIVQPKAFKLGTVFHECLHKLYLGRDEDTVVDYMLDELSVTNPNDVPMLKSMILGYARNVIPKDEHFKVLDIEHHFKLDPREFAHGDYDEVLRDIVIRGSIDMIALDTDTNKVWGFEHKTAKNYRNDVYLWMDEQPRVYYAALINWVKAYNKMHPDAQVELGGVYINEVKKLVRAFDYKRSALVYDDDDLSNFMYAFVTSCAECHRFVNSDAKKLPMPDMMACMNCMFNTICQTVQYKTLDKDYLTQEFRHEFTVRNSDHLEEKEEVNVK